ncbi:bacterio-opsin activator domain-containing protein [Natrialba asiatica]|uniref:PAS sensor protein n=1 Tax=Natrialba asiatica (strain ATCC 700177 / DSM 12278 / JCM 9576 / FERM P-10747 / NBRC 102637 / 172P1) TaxID=29540 RepID=M0AYN0_NATA1|nr:bacterio-opsin activator domain-containing protein [Natrialba asiatica]ELZ02504.1 PAS sensor protein [Natrialba asiatica DSM 12278]
MGSARMDDSEPTRLLVAGFDGEAEFSDESEDDGTDEAALVPAEVDDCRSVSTMAGARSELESDGPAVDCLVTAGELPDGTGLELLESIRRRERQTDADTELPVVLSPADGSEALASEAIAAGVMEYVPRSSFETGAGAEAETETETETDTNTGAGSESADPRPTDAETTREKLTTAIERAIAHGRTRKRRRAKARQFEAVFDDRETYAWVLAPDGTVRRANSTSIADRGASAGSDPNATVDASRGRSFWSLPLWESVGGDREAIRRAIETAATGQLVQREVTTERERATDRETRTLELTVRPVTDETGAVASLFVRATDVTERAALERERRESEELHRVTLNNMTDTVLITDDEGEFTYVCPNVHFIFGYTDEEIYEFGSIDDLLGPDLFDRDELAAEGVLTNIECTATDKAGREHTLLVNVREVSIQGGTILYSCRDVTMRKRREEALTALHRTARELLYAETDREIADIVVDDATDVLDLEASAVYLFDTDENVFRPAARSTSMRTLHGPLSPQRVGDSIAGEVFVDGESRFLADVHESPLLADPTTEIRSAAFVPLGDHGVFVAGSDEVGVFDDIRRELTDLLAATAEAAFDRVDRERTLRERDRELKRRNQQLSRLNRLNELIREIDHELVRAETREEIERGVCDRLTAADRFSFAWIGTTSAAGDRLEPRAHGGTDRGRDYLDSVSFSLSAFESAGADAAGVTDVTDTADVTDATDANEASETAGTDDRRTRLRHREPAVRTAVTRDETVVSNVVDNLRDQAWRTDALEREYQSVLAVPLSYDEFTYGVVTVYANQPDAFDDVTRTVLAELGETIASAIAGVERKHALLSNTTTRLEFAVADENFVFTRLARRADCTISFDGGVRQHENGATVFATVGGAPAAAVVTAASELVAVADAQVVSERPRSDSTDGSGAAAGDDSTDGDEREGTVRLELSRPFAAVQLADHGVVLRSVTATPEFTRVVVDAPYSVDGGGSVDIVTTAFSSVELRSKRQLDRTTPQDLRSELLDRLTDRQLEVVQLAYYSGYFESPRERSGEEIATMLSISAAAFYRHTRTVQRKLLTILFNELGVPASTAPPVE